MMDNFDNIALLQEGVCDEETKSLWVFAYGSLCWKPGFRFNKAVVGHVQGYNRRFWQGNITHRGTEENPGRVATLVQDEKGRVFGVAYAISGEDAIPYLSKRECDLGGYISRFSTFYPSQGEPFSVLMYIATPSNPHWLGDGKLADIANQIVNCSGPSGHNVEYILRLAQFMRQNFPKVNDQHLFTLEEEVMIQIRNRKMCLNTLMGDGVGCITFLKQRSASSSPQPQENEQERVETFQHTARVPEKVLRCLNI